MTAKEYLGQVIRLEKCIERRTAQLNTLRMQAQSISSPQLSERVQTTPTADQMIDCQIKINELENNINHLIVRCEEMRDKILNQIDAMENTVYADILYYVYVNGLKLLEVAPIINHEYKYTCTLHGLALQEFANKYLK